MSNNLKTIQTAYSANTHIHTHNGFSVRNHKGRLRTKQYNNYSRMPDMITAEADYYWTQGFNKMYGRYVRLVEPNTLDNQLDSFTLKIDKQLRMTDFYYDNVSKKDLKLIRQRFKKSPINLKGYNLIDKSYSSTSHRYTYIYIAWVINDRYIINDIRDFINLLKTHAI